MTSSFILDLSNAPGKENQLGDLTIPRSFQSDSLEDIKTVIASQCDLASLSVGMNATLADVAATVTVLSAPYNRLASIAGIEHFASLEVLDLHHNHLQVLDPKSTALLRKLKHLTTLDVSFNQLRLVDFDTSAEEGDLLRLSVVNLSHNELIEIPDLRSLPALTELNLNYNKIEDLTEVEGRLPLLALHTLKLRHNALPTATSIVPLTALAQTLKCIELYDNTFCQIDETDPLRASVGREGSAARRGSMLVPSADQPFWWRPFVLFLLPLLETIDLIELTRSEKQATALLFRNNQGELAKNFLELMNPHQKDELVNYLVKKCDHVLAPADMADILAATEEEDVTYVAEERQEKQEALLLESPGISSPDYYSSKHDNEELPHRESAERNVRPRTRSTMSSITSIPQTPTNGGRSASLTEVVRAMQLKLKSLTTVVEVLYKEDMIRKRFAAITIQKYIRGTLTRMHLSSKDAMRCAIIRERLRQLQHQGPAVGLEAPPALSPSSTTNMKEVLASMKDLQGLITTMWGDLEQYRAMLDREERRAAITIQRHFRGYLARQEWKVMKADYEEFVLSLSSYVLLMQRVGRGFRSRRHVQLNVVPRLEVFRLRGDVRTLQEQIVELRALIEKKDIATVRATQPRLSIDYTTEGRDPREEMEKIIRNFENKSGPVGHRLEEEKRRQQEEEDTLLQDNLMANPAEDPFCDETPDRLASGGNHETTFESESLPDDEEDRAEEEEEDRESSEGIDLLESPTYSEKEQLKEL
ncbi:leucine-richprotein [Angomonas deanei]|uniref:Leucine Rich repeats (2 copies)/Leucine rich repeat/IQ calmodulin-binding motif containing protein, putative n=1 Tax=Angomonas deanei TaxID=59799 RepID=A0A7G2CIK0_9TRYP|nr:leucine-richprotein [Angomonas deanei]CAD2218744.1 Leucine Rich repeats (2 copies)/Leucine rich repeat/IQ calmodulin-binding motif containing protein, putative [Angomonas deanei]|eukprot:EPY28865.1 leucine-richprotein [Angomonas deanei]